VDLFDPEGTGLNTLPHLLVAYLDLQGVDGVTWSLECPHTGLSKPCGMLQECLEHPRPVPPPGMPCDDNDAAWKTWRDADDEWEQDHERGGTHPNGDCWWEYMVRESDAEGFLSQMGQKRPITGPMQVAIASEGFDDMAEIVFRPWKRTKETQ
jgi:hypothetical protein